MAKDIKVLAEALRAYYDPDHLEPFEFWMEEAQDLSAVKARNQARARAGLPQTESWSFELGPHAWPPEESEDALY